MSHAGKSVQISQQTQLKNSAFYLFLRLEIIHKR